MASLQRDASLSDYTSFINMVYGIPNDRHYSHWDMLTNIQRFSMRAIKGIRKGNTEKVKTNLLISLSWYISLMNRMHIDVPEIVWTRFPYLCSYCGTLPCSCKAEKVVSRRTVTANSSMRPESVAHFQVMFSKIYPPDGRTATDAGIHLAEESGELSEAIHIYMGDRSEAHFDDIRLEAADYFSCVMGVMNSLNIDCAQELAKMFSNNCHFCNNAPCTCSFTTVSQFKS